MTRISAKGAAGEAPRASGRRSPGAAEDAELARVRALARFPSENPSPVLRVTGDGAVVYANDAARSLKGLLVGRGRKAAARGLADGARRVAHSGVRREVEFETVGRVFALALTPVAGETYINVYGRDITAERQARLELLAAKESLEERVRERTASVHLLQNIVIAANEAATVEAALQTTIDEVCAYTGWPVGHAYVLAGDGSGDLVPTDIWHLESSRRFAKLKAVTKRTRFRAGEGLPGRVLKRRKPRVDRRRHQGQELPEGGSGEEHRGARRYGVPGHGGPRRGRRARVLLDHGRGAGRRNSHPAAAHRHPGPDASPSASGPKRRSRKATPAPPRRIPG